MFADEWSLLGDQRHRPILFVIDSGWPLI